MYTVLHIHNEPVLSVTEADNAKMVNSFHREPLMNDYYKGYSTHFFYMKGCHCTQKDLL